MPFKSANVVCTPNGAEFNINVPACKEVFDLKPKTAVQVLFREWYDNGRADHKPEWKLLADGFYSGIVSGEDSSGGRAIGLVCRDFRMDIRKTPAALAWSDKKELVGEVQTEFSVHGINDKIVTQSLRNPESEVDVRIYDSSGLMDPGAMIARIAGTAYGNLSENVKNGGNALDTFNFSTSEISDEKMRLESNNPEKKKGGKKYANGGLFLDAFIRGLWLEAVGGTRPNSFLNARIRADKRFLVPRNFAGYNFWHRNSFGLEIGSAMMGNSRFSSLEAAIMNVAGMFSTRVYSCSTPSLIDLTSNNKALDYVMDEAARKFMVEQYSNKFGQPYMLNETMLLPPMEFTSPPNCNLFFPPMYDRISLQHDSDSDITRGYFGVIHSLSTTGGLDFGHVKFQIPNNLFGSSEQNPSASGKRPPLTLEERYKGVSVYHGNVEYNLAAADAAKTLGMMVTSEDGKAVIVAKKAEAEKNKKDANKPTQDSEAAQAAQSGDNNAAAQIDINKEVEVAKKKTAESVGAKALKSLFNDKAVQMAYKRHAMIKYLNLKYSGRVVTVEMTFNPFVMCGFPGAIISAVNELGTNISKTIIGTVQQVSHAIYITPQGAESNTTVIMNNARFEDEPTDLSEKGMPLYMQATNRDAAAYDINSGKFKSDIINPDNPYRVPNAKEPMAIGKEGGAFDLDEVHISEEGYLYVKDFLTTSTDDMSKGKDENIYLDKSYEPNRISFFYKHVFGHSANHFMIGSAGLSSPGHFVYDTMHEAFTELRKNRLLMTDYEYCINFVKRNVCSANAFYHAILGLSSKVVDSSGAPIYINNEAGSNDTEEPHIYWGIPTGKVSDDASKAGLSEGEFSSIREITPLTAFIRERREAVEAYRKAALNQAMGAVSEY